MLRFVTGVIFAAATALGQSADAPAPAAFEVASTKVSQSRSRGEGFGRDNIKTSPGSLTMLNVSLRTAIGWAYHVFDYQVTGPDWIGSERYDIVAKAAGPASEPEQRAMLQTLLADRFKLAVHRQTKEMSAMLLVVGKGGPKFQESKTEGDSSIQPQQKSMSIVAQRVPMSQLVDALARIFQVDPAKLPAYVGAPSEQGGFSIYRLVKVVQPPEPDAAKLAAAKSRVADMQNREVFDAYVAALKAKANVRVNQKNLDKK